MLLLVSYTKYPKYVRFYLLLPIYVTASIFTVSAFIFLTLTPNMTLPLMLPSFSPPFQKHIITIPIHYTGYTALLKSLLDHIW